MKEDPGVNTKKGFLYGTMLLVGAGLITKILGFVYRIALSRLIGDEGIGLFYMAFPILSFTLVITTAGLPVAISKLVSEAEAKGEEKKIRTILIISTTIVTITSIVVSSLLLIGAPFISQWLLTDERAIYALLAITPIIPIIAISSIFRGYFQGRQNMSPYAISTIFEQSVRILTVLLLASYLLPYGVEYAAAGAVIGMVIGEFIGMAYLVYRFKKDPTRPRFRLKKENKPTFIVEKNESRTVLRSLLRIAIPVTTSRMFGSFAYAIEPIVVSQSLAIAGIATATATSMYGQLEGMAIPLVFFPSFITYAVSVSLIPAVSEAQAKQNPRLIEHRLNQAIWLSLIITAPCALLLFMLAEPLAIVLYREPDVARLMQIMAPFTIIHALQSPFASVLQGLDQADASMRNSIFGAIMKTILTFVLASQPSLGIDGVAIAINCGIVMVTALHFRDLIRLVPFSISLRNYGKLLLSITLTGLAVAYIPIPHTNSLLTQLCFSLGVGMSIYGACLIVLKLIRREDVLQIPYIGKWMAFIFR